MIILVTDGLGTNCARTVVDKAKLWPQIIRKLEFVSCLRILPTVYCQFIAKWEKC